MNSITDNHLVLELDAEQGFLRIKENDRGAWYVTHDEQFCWVLKGFSGENILHISVTPMQNGRSSIGMLHQTVNSPPVLIDRTCHWEQEEATVNEMLIELGLSTRDHDKHQLTVDFLEQKVIIEKAIKKAYDLVHEMFGEGPETSRARVYWHNNIASWLVNPQNSCTMDDTYQAMEEESRIND